MTLLDTAIREYIDAYFRFRPGEATEKGYAQYDAHAPSFGPEDVAVFRAAVARAKESIRGVEAEKLDTDDALDLTAFRSHLETALFDIDRLHLLESSPLIYVLSGLDSLEALELHEKRGDELINRLRGIPRLMAQAQANVDAPMNPYREVAIEMLTSGVEHLAETYGQGGFDPRVVEAADEARRAMDRYAEHLDKSSERARPFAPMGEEAYLFLLANEHLLSDGLEPITSLAHQTLANTRKLLEKLGLDKDDDDEEENAPEIPADFSWQNVLDYYHSELATVRRFVEEKKIVTIPAGSLELKETPEWLRALIPGVSYLPPPAFSSDRRGFLFVRPVPRKMDDEERRRLYERVTYRWFRNTVAHECWPGHHVQLLRAADHPRPIRKFRDNDVMVEGWGLYSESVVREQGLWEESGEPQWSYRSLMFRAVRVVLDVGIHTGRFTLEGAIDWACEQFGEGVREWISTEIRRYATEPTQAMSYLVGQDMIHSLRDEWMDVAPRGSDRLLRFHDAFTGEGSLPIPLIRRKMLEQAAKR